MSFNDANLVAVAIRRRRIPNPFSGMKDDARNAAIEKLKQEFFANGGTITRVPRGTSGYRPPPRRGRQIRF